jgi:hypothetical protein
MNDDPRAHQTIASRAEHYASHTIPDPQVSLFRNREYLLSIADYVRAVMDTLGRVDDCVEKEGILDVKVMDNFILTM